MKLNYLEPDPDLELENELEIKNLKNLNLNLTVKMFIEHEIENDEKKQKWNLSQVKLVGGTALKSSITIIGPGQNLQTSSSC